MKFKDIGKFCVKRYCRHRKVTGSMFYYEVYWPNGRNFNFFVEAGAKQGENNSISFNRSVPFDVKKMRFGVITHNHADHAGSLPGFVRQGFRGPIYMSHATKCLIDIPLYDSTTIKDEFSGDKICSIDEVKKTLKQVVGCRLEELIKPTKDITIVFFSNGHIVGATIVLIIITCAGREPITILHTGDYKPENIFFDVRKPPKKARKMSISNVVCESTYGNFDSTDPIFNECLARNTAEALKNGKTVIFPTLAQDKHQRMLWDIKTWKSEGIISEGTMVIVDGKSSQEYNARYQGKYLGINPNMRNFMLNGVVCVPQSKFGVGFRNEIFNNSDPKIILAPSGNGDNGAISNYLLEYIPREDVLIHSLGYCPPSSIMYRLLNTAQGETIHYKGTNLTVRCSTAKTSEKRSHATRDELLNLIQCFPNIRSIYINHGETDVQSNFREYLLENLSLPEDQILTANPEVGVVIESNGITDIFPTNL